MWEKILIVIVAVPLAILLIRGLWRATGAQSGTGCPICDSIQGGDHDHDHDHDHSHGHDHDHSPEKS